jgi:putative flippase GtrA
VRYNHWILKSLFLRFILIGVLNTLVGYAIFALCLKLGFNYSVSLLIATCLGVLFNFKSIGLLVFSHPGQGVLLKFILVYVLIYAVNISIIKLLNPFIASLYLCGLIAMGVAAVVSFFLNKRYVFNVR